MKKTILKVGLILTVVLTATSCTKEESHQPTIHSETVAPYVPAIFEGTWQQHTTNEFNDSIPVEVFFSREVLITDSLEWNMHLSHEYKNYVLDTNGTETYKLHWTKLLHGEMEIKRTDLINGDVETFYYNR